MTRAMPLLVLGLGVGATERNAWPHSCETGMSPSKGGLAGLLRTADVYRPWRWIAASAVSPKTFRVKVYVQRPYSGAYQEN